MSFNKESLKAAFSKEKLHSRKFKHGGLATIITVLFLAAVIIVNMIMGVLADKIPMSADLTQKQSFALTEDSINFVKGITKNIDIYVLNEEAGFTAQGDYYVQANNVIKQYAQYSNKVNVQYINATKNPTFLTAYSSESPSTNDIIVKCGDKHKLVTSSDLFNTTYNSSYQQTISSSKAEQAITSALLNVTSDHQVKVSVLTGCGEQDSSGFVSLLKQNNYEVKEQSIISEDIDTESKIAIVFAPSRDYDEAGIKKLKAFLSNGETWGKTVVYVPDFQQSSLPNLETFLEEWSVAIKDGVAFESNSKKLASNNYCYALSEYVEETYTKAIKSTNSYVFMPFAKPLKVLNSDKVKTLLQYSSTSGIIPSNAESSWQPKSTDISGPIPVAVVSTSTKYQGTTPMISNVAVVGSYYAFDSSILSQSTVNNSAYFINMFNILSEREDTITIESKTVGGEQMGVTAAQGNALFVVFAAIIPLLVLLTGLVIWIRRRNR